MLDSGELEHAERSGRVRRSSPRREGVQTQLHRLLGVDERYLVIEGVGELEIGGAPGV